MVALPSDVARSGRTAKQAYQKVFRAMVDLLQRSSGGQDRPDRALAVSIAALCAGGMIIARASDDRMLADEVREACIAVALKLGGWDQPSLSPLATAQQVDRRGRPSRKRNLPRNKTDRVTRRAR